MAVTFDTRQIEALKQRQIKAREALQNNGVVMRQISIFLDRWVQKNFQSSGGAVGEWEKYKYGGRLTTKDKANGQSLDGHRWINGSAKLLMDTGALRLSFLPFASLGNAGIGSDLPYAKFHQEGTKTLPQRRMLPVKSEVQADIKEIMTDWLRITIRKMV